MAKAAETNPATRRGLWAWAFYDWANNAFFTVIMTFVFAPYFARAVAGQPGQAPATQSSAAGAAASGASGGGGVLGMSVWGYALAVSGVVIAVGGPVLGAIADQAGRRKPWIGLFTGVCVLATAGLYFVKPDESYLWLAIALVMLGQIGADYAILFYNAMLPAIASRQQLGRWSGWGWALGYAGGLGCLLLALLFVSYGPGWGLDTQSAQHVRLAFVMAAAWYAVFALPMFLFTPDAARTSKPFNRMVRDGFGQLRETISHVRQYRPIVRFLIARMIYIDGLGTVFAFGGIYAGETFAVNELHFGIAINVTAGLGAASFAWIDDWIGSRRTILLSLVALAVCGTVLVVAPSAAWFWVFGLVLGIFFGPVQAASRSYLARLAPAHLRNEVFGLYALSGKATAFLGPLMVGGLTHLASQVTSDTTSRRLGMAGLLIFFAVGFVVMWPLPNLTRAEPETA